MSQHYSIKDIEALSGIKAHTIRIWEKRYNIIEPIRSETNIRLYNNDELRKFLNVANLVNNGVKISKVAQLSQDEIASKIQELSLSSLQTKAENVVNDLIQVMMEFNENKFHKIFEQCVLEYGFYQTITDFIYPFLQRVGILWGIGKIVPTQEHFMSNLIRQKFIVAIDDLGFHQESKAKVLLFLPEGEHHELGLLLVNYILRSHKINTLYLGENVPNENLHSIKDSGITHIYSYHTTTKSTEDLQEQITALNDIFGGKNWMISGNPVHFEDLDLPENIKTITTMSGCSDFAASISNF